MGGHSTNLWIEGNVGRGLTGRDRLCRERWRHRKSNPPPDIGERDRIVARSLPSACPSSTLALRYSVLL